MSSIAEAWAQDIYEETRLMQPDVAARVKESISELILAIDDKGWEPLTGVFGDTGPDINQVKHLSRACRKLYAGSPIAKRAVRLRIGYIWSSGIEAGKGRGQQAIVDKNQESLFSPNAIEEFESGLSTDGNLFNVLDRTGKTIDVVPLDEITGWYCKPGFKSRVEFWERTWTEQRTDRATGQPRTIEKRLLYPTPDFVGKLPDMIGKVAVVSTGQAMHHVRVNSQRGWVLGVPDLTAAVLWVKAYKEFLEGGQAVNQALARISMKAVSKTPGGGQRVATQLGSNEKPGSYGAAANLVGGVDLSFMNRAGAMVDLDAGRALAAMIAAGMEISLVALLTDSSKGQQATETTLDEPTLNAMRLRQAIDRGAIVEMMRYFGISKPQIIFPPIRSVPVHRLMQAFVTALSSNLINPEEARPVMGMFMAEYGMSLTGKLPEAGAWAQFLSGIDPQAAADAANGAIGQDPDHPGTTPAKTPKGASNKKKSPAGATSDGDHEQRASQ